MREAHRQAAFDPSHFVPGIEPSDDKMLQGRLMAYSDTQYHLLGVNFMQIPINCPFATKVVHLAAVRFMIGKQATVAVNTAVLLPFVFCSCRRYTTRTGMAT